MSNILNESDEYQDEMPTPPQAPATPAQPSVVKLIAEWIHMDVSEKQIQDVLWAIMMGDLESSVSAEVAKMRADYEAERNASEEGGEDYNMDGSKVYPRSTPTN